MSVKEQVSLPTQRICSRCKFVSSQEVCKACVLLEGLNKGLPKLGIGKSSKAKRMLEEYNSKQTQNESNKLEEAVNDLNDVSNVAIDKSKGLCRNKKNTNKENDNVDNKCNKNNCCGGTCKSNAKNIDPAVSNKKLNMLLEQYGLDEQNTEDLSNTEKVNGSHIEGENSDNEEPTVNGDDEDDTCSSSCGRLGSLQIGF